MVNILSVCTKQSLASQSWGLCGEGGMRDPCLHKRLLCLFENCIIAVELPQVFSPLAQAYYRIANRSLPTPRRPSLPAPLVSFSVLAYLPCALCELCAQAPDALLLPAPTRLSPKPTHPVCSARPQGAANCSTPPTCHQLTPHTGGQASSPHSAFALSSR